MNQKTPTTRHRAARRRTAMLILTASATVVLSSCGARPADLEALPPIEGTVTFKTIEKGEEVRYRVEVTYPDDPALFEVDLPADASPQQQEDARDSGRYSGAECWFDVQPDDYQYLRLGDPVQLGHPANDDRQVSFEEAHACELAQELAPSSYVPENEYTPDQAEETTGSEG